jgi:hypothetical protein
VTVTSAAFRSTAPSRATAGATASTAQLSHLSSSQRSEVLNAMNHLREMPPFAREREINDGRYSHFSPEERQLLSHMNQ